MGNQYFKFKKFSVFQDRTAMKVGVDSVLLGAWCELGGAKQILDVGTGTGLLALMCAQRNLSATVLGVEIDADATSQARGNFDLSPWNCRLKATNVDFQAFTKETVAGAFDFVISNPPYFQEGSRAMCRSKAVARHTDSLSFKDLLVGVASVLSEQGKFALVLPFDIADLFCSMAEGQGLFLVRKCEVFAARDKLANRALLEFSKEPGRSFFSTLVIYEKDRTYTPEYITLTKDFYLKF